MFLVADLLNVFETFLPQLLLYPNPTDPLNGEAAALLMREPEAYNAKVKGKSGHFLVQTAVAWEASFVFLMSCLAAWYDTLAFSAQAAAQSRLLSAALGLLSCQSSGLHTCVLPASGRTLLQLASFAF